MLFLPLLLTTLFIIPSQTTPTSPSHDNYSPNHSSNPYPHPYPFQSNNPFCNQAISLRFPPTVQLNTPPTWTPPPYAWIFGNWKIRYSSRPTYATLYNFQVDHYPVLPTQPSNSPAIDRIQTDLTSFQFALTGNNTIDSKINTVFGYDNPQPNIAPVVFKFNGTGPLSTLTNDWEILAWGYDNNGTGYRVEYETQVEGPDNNGPGESACINILSRSETGPDTQTLEKIMEALKSTYAGNADLLKLVNEIVVQHVDGRRSNLGPVGCDQACLVNAS